MLKFYKGVTLGRPFEYGAIIDCELNPTGRWKIAKNKYGITLYIEHKSIKVTPGWFWDTREVWLEWVAEENIIIRKVTPDNEEVYINECPK